MRTYYLCDVDEPDWAPLRKLADLLMSDDSDLPVIEPDHFMYMARISAKGQSDIHLYKHYYTRRYLNLDDHGHAYAYVPRHDDGARARPDDYMGRYRLLPDLATAVARLDVEFVDNCEMDPEQRAKLVRRQLIKAAQARPSRSARHNGPAADGEGAPSDAQPVRDGRPAPERLQA